MAGEDPRPVEREVQARAPALSKECSAILWRHAILTQDAGLLAGLRVDGWSAAKRRAFAARVATPTFARQLVQRKRLDVLSSPPGGLHELAAALRRQHGDTMLMEAAGAGDTDAVHTLLTGTSRQTLPARRCAIEALRTALGQGHDATCIVLVRRVPLRMAELYPDYTRLMVDCAKRGCGDMARLLMEHIKTSCAEEAGEGEDRAWAWNAVTHGACSAARVGRYDMMQLFLQSEVTFVAQALLVSGELLFQNACMGGCMRLLQRTCRRLKDAGWDGVGPNAAADGLKAAAQNGRYGIVRALLYGTGSCCASTCSAACAAAHVGGRMQMGDWRRGGGRRRLLPSVYRKTSSWRAADVGGALVLAAEGGLSRTMHALADADAWAAAMPRKKPWWTLAPGRRALLDAVRYAVSQHQLHMLPPLLNWQCVLDIPGLPKVLEGCILALLLNQHGGEVVQRMLRTLRRAFGACIRRNGAAATRGLSAEFVRIVRHDSGEAMWRARRSMLLLRAEQRPW